MGSDGPELHRTESGSSLTFARWSKSLLHYFSTVWTASESLGTSGSRDVLDYTVKGIITTESCPVTGITVSPGDTER